MLTIVDVISELPPVEYRLAEVPLPHHQAGPDASSSPTRTPIPAATTRRASSRTLAGHDAASFTTGEDGVPAAVNDSGAAPVAPDAPTGLMAEAAGDTAIVLTWRPPAYNGGSAVTGYLIEVSPDGTDGSFTTLEANHDVREDGGEDAAIVTAYTHTGLTRATTRHYRVKAINAAGTGAASGTDFATTTMVAPGAPTGLAATAHDAMPGDASTQIDLAWTAPAAIEGVAPPTGYRIEVSPDGASDWEELVEDTGTTDVAYSDAGLPSETTRHYRVSARNAPGAAGLGPPSNVDGATSEDIEPPTGRRTPVVFINGIQMAISYDLSLDVTDTNAPLVSAFTVTADGIPITVGAVVSYSIQITGLGRVHRILLSPLSPTIKRGQRVTVTYTDPTDGDDVRAIQDVHGNDAASFTLTARNGSRLDDPTLPGAPTGLAATANDAMQGDTLHADRPRLDRAGGDRGGSGADRLPHRVVARRNLGLGGAGRGHQHHGRRLQRRRPPPGDDPPLPGLRDQRQRHRARPRTSTTPPPRTSSRRPNLERHSCTSTAFIFPFSTTSLSMRLMQPSPCRAPSR